VEDTLGEAQNRKVGLKHRLIYLIRKETPAKIGCLMGLQASGKLWTREVTK